MAGFWNKVLSSKNTLLLAVAKSERAIAMQGCTKCWWHEVQQGMTSWGIDELPHFQGFQEVDVKAVHDRVQSKTDSELHRFVGAELRSDTNRPDKPKTACYRVWFWQDWGRKLPVYFSLKELSYEQVVSVARFRLSSHFLMVEKGRHVTPRIPWSARKCTRCSQGQVDDEYHLLFECEQFAEQRHTLSPLNFLPGDLTSNSLADFADPKVCQFVAECMSKIES